MSFTKNYGTFLTLLCSVVLLIYSLCSFLLDYLSTSAIHVTLPTTVRVFLFFPFFIKPYEYVSLCIMMHNDQILTGFSSFSLHLPLPVKVQSNQMFYFQQNQFLCCCSFSLLDFVGGRSFVKSQYCGFFSVTPIFLYEK